MRSRIIYLVLALVLITACNGSEDSDSDARLEMQQLRDAEVLLNTYENAALQYEQLASKVRSGDVSEAAVRELKKMESSLLNTKEKLQNLSIDDINSKVDQVATRISEIDADDVISTAQKASVKVQDAYQSVKESEFGQKTTETVNRVRESEAAQKTRDAINRAAESDVAQKAAGAVQGAGQKLKGAFKRRR